jgi:hypothetical protein
MTLKKTLSRRFLLMSNDKSTEDRLSELEKRYPTRGDRVFYLAIPPTVFEDVVVQLAPPVYRNKRKVTPIWSLKSLLEEISPQPEDPGRILNLDSMLVHQSFFRSLKRLICKCVLIA